MRILIEQVKPLAKSRVYLPLGSFTYGPEANRCARSIRPLDVGAEVLTPSSQRWCFPFSSHYTTAWNTYIRGRLGPSRLRVYSEKKRSQDFYSEFTQNNYFLASSGEIRGDGARGDENTGVSLTFVIGNGCDFISSENVFALVAQ